MLTPGVNVKMKTKILGTGLSGLVGSRVVELLQDKYDFEDLSLDTGVDITDIDQVDERIGASDAKVVLHMAAITNVDACEKERSEGKNSLSWKVNVTGTENIVSAVKACGKRLIHFSTDFVFSGLEDIYTEESKPNPINWYGETKYRAEKAVRDGLGDYVILRTAFPYRAEFKRMDIVRFFMQELTQGNMVNAIEDWIITPTYIDDLAEAIYVFITNRETGIYHAVGSASQSPYEVALSVADVFGFDKTKVRAVKLEDLFAKKAPRPHVLKVDNGKITKLGLEMKTLEQGLNTIKKQLK